MSAATVAASRLLPSDTVRLGLGGLISRPTRAILSALGIAIGIAAMIAVVGISTSSQAHLGKTLDRLGTNLLTASPGRDVFGEQAELPIDTVGRLLRVPGVEIAGTLGVVDDAHAYRSSATLPSDTNGIQVYAASPRVIDVAGGSMASGTWLTDGQSEFPVVVLGSTSAEKLGVTSPGQQIVIGTEVFTVAGILAPVELAEDLDLGAFIGESMGTKLLGQPVHPTKVFLRADEETIAEVRELIPRTVAPQSAGDVVIQRPSDALAAKNASNQAFTGLLVGLGSVALLVGGIGVANTMVISVLERRKEIGLRRALGAARPHIRRQFLAEALFLSLLGGVGGLLIGSAVTAAFASSNAWPIVIPPFVLVGGLGATLVIGALAGLYPAMRAARIPPTEALQS